MTEIGYFMGLKVVENPSLRVPDQLVTRIRGWKERLFTRPWRPLERTVEYMTSRPDPNFYVLADDIITAHPETMARLRRSYDELRST